MQTERQLRLPDVRHMIGYGTTKIYEGIKSVLSRMVEKMAKLHTCQKARLCVRFLRYIRHAKR